MESKLSTVKQSNIVYSKYIGDLEKKLKKQDKILRIIKEKQWFDDFMKEHLTREWFTKDELDLLKEELL